MEDNIDPKLIAWREAKTQLIIDRCTEENYKGLQLEVMGLASAEAYVPGDDEVCISIYAYYHPEFKGTSRPENLSKKFVDILYMEFDDRPDMKYYDPRFDTAIEITEAQAAKIAQFVIKHRDKKKIVIHCFAGASRSRSTAAAIATVLKLPYSFTVLNTRVFTYVKAALEQLLV